jgi:phospholipid/cholesterol/gamma-HCH transport system substrate-binding protein
VITDIHAATRTASVDFVAAVQQLRATSNNLDRATGSVDAFVAENRDQLSGFVRGGLPQIELLLRDSRAAAQEIRDLSRSLRDNPSQLIYQPAANGVVIPP